MPIPDPDLRCKKIEIPKKKYVKMRFRNVRTRQLRNARKINVLFADMEKSVPFCMHTRDGAWQKL